jgi:hypothetical protein
LKVVSNDQTETTVQAWVGIANTLFTSKTVESSWTNASEEVHCSDLAGTTVLTWVVVTWVGSNQVDFTADTVEAGGARATEGTMTKIANTTILTREKRCERDSFVHQCCLLTMG